MKRVSQWAFMVVAAASLVLAACTKEENDEVIDQFLPRFSCEITGQPAYSTRATAWSLINGRTVINATPTVGLPDFNLIINGSPAVGTYTFEIDFDTVNVDVTGFYRINGSTNPDSAYSFKRATINISQFENNRIRGTFNGVVRRINGDSLVISNGVLENIPKL